jgi:hypothetical protein
MTATQVERLVGRRYAEVCGEQSRSGNKDYLVKRIAWRMQANEFGDLPERARRRAMEIASNADLRLRAPTALPAAAPGSLRETVAIQATHHHDPRLVADADPGDQVRATEFKALAADDRAVRVARTGVAERDKCLHARPARSIETRSGRTAAARPCRPRPSRRPKDP